MSLQGPGQWAAGLIRGATDSQTHGAHRTMGIAFQLHRTEIRFRTTGDVDYGDGLQTMRSAFAAAKAPDAGTLWDLLFDISESQENRSSDELRGVAEEIERHRELLPGRAAVVATNPLHYGLARMFCVFMQSVGFEAMVFASVGEGTSCLQSLRSTA